MKRIFLIVCAVGLLGCLPSCLSHVRGDDLVASTPLKSTYRIIATHTNLDTGTEVDTIGSGTGVSPYHILTCSHTLCANADGKFPRTKLKQVVAIKPETGFQWKLNVISYNPKWQERYTDNGTYIEDDLALLESASIGDTRYFDFVPLESEDNIQNSEKEVLGAIGYPGNGSQIDVIPFKLFPNDLLRPTYTGYADNKSGTSGGGVFTPEGKLAGVAWGNSDGVISAVPLTSIVQWTRVKQYQQTPYGGFQKQVYRDFNLLGRRRPVPVLQLVPPAVNPAQQPAPTTTAPAANTKQTNIIESKVNNTACGSMGCGSGGGGGMMMSRMNSRRSGGGGGMSGMAMSQGPPMMQQQIGFAQQPMQQGQPYISYDPNVSPYAQKTRPQVANNQQKSNQEKPGPADANPNEKQVQNTASTTTVKSSPCKCDKKELEAALDKIESNLNAKIDQATTQLTVVTRPTANQTETKPCDCATENQSQFAAIKEGLKSVEDRLGSLSDRVDVAVLLQAPTKQNASVPVSTGNSPTTATPTPIPLTPQSPPHADSGVQELIYLTAVNSKDCKKTDDLVERMRAAGMVIRIIRLNPDQVTSPRDVPRLSVFNGPGNVKPESYLGPDKISNFLATLK